MTRLRSDEALNHFNTALDEKVGPVDVESPVIETAWNSLQETLFKRLSTLLARKALDMPVV